MCVLFRKICQRNKISRILPFRIRVHGVINEGMRANFEALVAGRTGKFGLNQGEIQSGLFWSERISKFPKIIEFPKKEFPARPCRRKSLLDDILHITVGLRYLSRLTNGLPLSNILYWIYYRTWEEFVNTLPKVVGFLRIPLTGKVDRVG